MPARMDTASSTATLGRAPIDINMDADASGNAVARQPASDPELEALIVKIESADPAARCMAARALRKYGRKASPAIPALIKILGDDTAYYVRTIGDAPPGHVPEQNAVTVGREAGKALAAIGEESMNPLFGALRDSNPQVRWYAIEALALFKSQVPLPSIRGMLNDSDSGPRWAAIVAVGELKDRASVPKLAAMLKDETDSEARRRVIVALGEIGSSDAEAVLKAAQPSETDVTLRAYIDGALRRIQNRQ